MIYLFYGDDLKSRRKKYENFLDSFSSDFEFVSITRNNFNQNTISNFYSSLGLFSKPFVITLENLLEQEEISEFFLKNIDKLMISPNIFIFLEFKLLKTVVDVFSKNKAKIEYFEIPKEKKEKFDNFLLADAFARKDKFHLWFYFRQAEEKGVGLEELVGVLFWKIKDLILRKNFQNFSEEKLKNMASKLSYLLPEARENSKDASIVFEKFLLGMF